MTIDEFEEKIWNFERVRIVIRKPQGHLIQVPFPIFVERCSDQTTVSDFIRDRLQHRNLSGFFESRDVIVIDGNGSTPHGNTHLGTVRNSYTD